MKVVDDQLGAVARPARVRFVSVLPKTRSGKLLRRAIQAVCERRDPGDLTTIEDPAALQQIKDLVSPLASAVAEPELDDSLAAVRRTDHAGPAMHTHNASSVWGVHMRRFAAWVAWACIAVERRAGLRSHACRDPPFPHFSRPPRCRRTATTALRGPRRRCVRSSATRQMPSGWLRTTTSTHCRKTGPARSIWCPTCTRTKRSATPPTPASCAGRTSRPASARTRRCMPRPRGCASATRSTRCC